MPRSHFAKATRYALAHPLPAIPGLCLGRVVAASPVVQLVIIWIIVTLLVRTTVGTPVFMVGELVSSTAGIAGCGGGHACTLTDEGISR